MQCRADIVTRELQCANVTKAAGFIIVFCRRRVKVRSYPVASIEIYWARCGSGAKRRNADVWGSGDGTPYLGIF